MNLFIHFIPHTSILYIGVDGDGMDHFGGWVWGFLVCMGGNDQKPPQKWARKFFFAIFRILGLELTSTI